MREYSKESGMEQFGKKEWTDYFRNRFAVNGDLLKAIFEYRNLSKRGLVLNWLRGAVDGDHVHELGVRERSDMPNGGAASFTAKIAGIRSMRLARSFSGSEASSCFWSTARPSTGTA